MRTSSLTLTWFLAAALAGVACSGARVPAEPDDNPAESSSAEAQPDPSASTTPPPVAGDRAQIPALATRLAAGDPAAATALEALVQADPQGLVGDHAALVLGSTRVDQGDPAEALPLLGRAARGHVAPEYARVLLARAVVEAQATGEVAATHALLLPVVETAATQALASAARLRLMQLAALAGSWAEAGRWGRELLARGVAAAQLDETRWLTAEALRLAGDGEEARGLYRAIWLDTPGSPWGTRARERLAELGEVTAPAQSERLDWIAKLQSAGLHRDALAALEPLHTGETAAQVRAPVRAQALHLAARSHFVLRENDRVVERAAALRRDHASSSWAARGAMEAIRALGRDDRIADFRAWEQWLRTTHRDSEPAHEARYYVGTQLAGQRAHESAGIAMLEELAAGTGTRAPDASWRLAWIAHRRGDPTAASATLERLLERHPKTGYRAAALYWLARWSTPADGSAARERYRQVRREYPRDYYGQLAAERLVALGEELAPLGTGASLTLDPLADRDRRPEPAYRSAVDLHRLGLPALAADELATIDTSGDPALELARTVLHAQAGDTWTAIAELGSRHGEQLRPQAIGATAVPPEVWRALYPFPYRDAVERAVRRRAPAGQPFDAFLLAALARRESRFWSRAVSHAGAVGLLQLMPDTAASTARKLGVPPPGREGLFDPPLNLELGTALLASHVRSFEGHWAPAIASYNAGDHVVRGWWQRRAPGQPIDEWIESIPYLETRLYVKAILGDYRNYRELYGPAAGEAASAGRDAGR